MRVLVCGGRDYPYVGMIYGVLDRLSESVEVTAIIHGACGEEMVVCGQMRANRGADLLARDWAIDRSITHIPYPADWNKHGKAAGPIRNQHMIDDGKPDLVVAFPGGRGTADMVRRARIAGVRVIEVE